MFTRTAEVHVNHFKSTDSLIATIKQARGHHETRMKFESWPRTSFFYLYGRLVLMISVCVLRLHSGQKKLDIIELSAFAAILKI